MTETETLKGKLLALHNKWFAEWKDLCRERDARPTDHPHRQIWEGMCNVQTARIRDIQELLKP